MKRALLLVFLALGFLILQAQESKWGISYTPTLIATSSTHYGQQPGVEYRINDRFSLLTELAMLLHQSKDPTSMDNRYFRLKPELRYAISPEKSILTPYTGLQVFYA